MPVPRPKAGEADKQVDELAQAVEETLAARRANPLYGPPGGMAGHFVATARLLQRRAALTPAQGSRKVFLLAEADRLVPQEASQEAANALLKLLEEPPADTQFVLTVTDPNLLLPTVRSRTVALRLGRLPDRLVEQFLAERLEPRPSQEQLRGMVARAGGAIGRAIIDGDETARARQAAREVMEATRKGEAARAERALKQGAWSARGDFSAMLEALADLLGEEARGLSDSDSGSATKSGSGLPQLVQARERVLEARDLAQGNVNPQLLLAALQADLAEAV
jgi:DNA polymerase-3 subunit delta'